LSQAEEDMLKSLEKETGKSIGELIKLGICNLYYKDVYVGPDMPPYIPPTPPYPELPCPEPTYQPPYPWQPYKTEPWIQTPYNTKPFKLMDTSQPYLNEDFNT